MIPSLSILRRKPVAAALSLDFLNEATDYRITFSGGVNGTRTNSAGVLVPAVCPRIDYGNVRTNYIRNNTMVGAVAADRVERILNGNFPGTDGAGWTTVFGGGTGTVDFSVAGQATVNGDVSHQSNLTQAISTISGLTYTITLTATANVFVQVGNTTSSSSLLGVTVFSGVAKKVQFTATAATTWIGFAISSGSTTLSNISVQSAGKLPSFWSSGGADGLIRTVTNVDIENGMACADVRYSGTASAGLVGFTINQELTTFTQSFPGQVWTHSMFLRLLSGSLSGVAAVQINIRSLDGTTAVKDNISGPDLRSLITGAPLASQRYIATATLSDTTAITVMPTLRIQTSGAGSTVDFTLRIGMPQFEQGSAATNPILTAGSIASAADPKGLLIEDTRTNVIRNNTMVGGIAPSVPPTNWASLAGFSIGGINPTCAYGTENGIPYIDLIYSGSTTTQTANAPTFELTTLVAASAGQVWAQSTYVKLQAGSLPTNLLFQHTVREYDSGGVFSAQTIKALTPTGAALITQRQINVATLSGATTAFVSPGLRFDTTSVPLSTVISLTLRIGLPQLELGVMASTPIFTSGTSLARNSDAPVMNGTNFSPWFNPLQGTFVAEAECFETDAATNRFALCVSDGTLLEEHLLFRSGTSYNNSMNAGGVSQGNAFHTTPLLVNTVWKDAYAYGPNDLMGCDNGNLMIGDNNLTLPNVNQLTIGRRSNNTFALNGHIRRITYYPYRVPNTMLQSLTR